MLILFSSREQGSEYLDLGSLPCHLAPVYYCVHITYASYFDRLEGHGATTMLDVGITRSGTSQGGVDRTHESIWYSKALKEGGTRRELHGVFILIRPRRQEELLIFFFFLFIIRQKIFLYK